MHAMIHLLQETVPRAKSPHLSHSKDRKKEKKKALNVEEDTASDDWLRERKGTENWLKLARVALKLLKLYNGG